MGQSIVVLNSAEVTKDLLHRKAGIYSDRPISALYDMHEILLMALCFCLYIPIALVGAVSLVSTNTETYIRPGVG